MIPSHPESPVVLRFALNPLLRSVPPWLRGSWRVALLIAAAIAGYFLVSEHWNHLADQWLVLLLLACPLMHLFHGHGGHTARGEHHRSAARNPNADRGRP